MVKQITRKFHFLHELFLRNRLKGRFIVGEEKISEEHIEKVKKFRANIIKIIILGVVVTIFWPIFSGNWQSFKLNLGASKTEDGATELQPQDKTPVMLKPRFYGEDENKQPYFLSAQSAVNLTDEKIVLFEIDGNIKLKNNEILHIQSETGDYFSEKKNLNLTGGVEIASDKGYIIKTNSANLKVDKNMATGSELVYIEGVLGDITARGFTIQNSGDVIEFFNDVELNAYQEPREEIATEIKEKIEEKLEHQK